MTTAPKTISEELQTPFAHPAGGEGGGTLTFGDVTSMLRRRMPLIVILFFVFLAMTLGGFVAWWFLFPGYRGECLIECISNVPELQLSLEQQRLRQDEHERFVLTQALLLKSPNILNDALKVTAVRETDWFKRVMKGGGEPMIELDDDLSAGPARGTNFLRVTMECRNPEDPPSIINEVVNQWYFNVKKRSTEEFTATALDQAKKEQETIERDIAAKRDRLRGIAQRMPSGGLRDPANNITAQQVRQYGDQVAQLQLELSQLEQYRAIYNDPESIPITAEDRAIVEQDPQVAELARAMFFLEQQRAADVEVYGPEHKEVRRLDAQIRAADEKLSERRLEKLRERRSDIREAANTAYLNTQHALFLAQENLQRAEAQQQDQDRLLFDYTEIAGEVNRDLGDRDQLIEYVRGLQRVKDQRTAIRVNVAQPAIKPLERSTPSLYLIPVGGFLAVILSLGVGLGVELLDKSVRTPQDLVRHVEAAVLGIVPDVDDDEVAIEKVETAVRDVPRSMVAEAFRRIRTNLQFSAPVDKQRSIAVVGARPEDGTTSVACNLALSLAQAGRRVLLVDANLRRPALSRVFANVGARGLSNVLIGDGAWTDMVGKTDQPQLDVLGSGPTPPNPVELLGGQHLRRFLDEATAKYEQVIFDTAPILLASDAAVLSAAVDGAILVIRANRSSRGIARRAWTLLTEVNARIFGTVLNAARVARGGYFREQLRTFYEYQPDRPEDKAG